MTTTQTDIDPSTILEQERVQAKSAVKIMTALRHTLEIKRRHTTPTCPTGDMDPRTASDLRLVAEELKLIWDNENGD